MKRIGFRTCCALLLVFAAIRCASAAETALDRYVAKPDANYAYTLYHEDSDLVHEAYFLHLTSQQWRSAADVDRPVWEHEVQVVVPASLHASSQSTALLIVNGGSNSLPLNTETSDLLKSLALLSGSVVAMVSQIPNQPLYFTDEVDVPRSEDEILAYSLDKYLLTADEEWPVHLAMTKAVVRAMDALQSFLAGRETDIDDFIVLGGSKRGWTTWLTAAVDPRVKAIVPISIDLLNMSPQFAHHWETYGFYAPAIVDYAGFELPCRMQTEPGRGLLEIIDPYAYRDRYAGLPKLIINSAGDQFFVSDSSNFYFHGLPEPKDLRYTFNTDHKQGEDQTQLMDVVSSALLWIDNVNGGHESPDFDWSVDLDGSIRVVARDEPTRVKLWQASNPSARDFRLERIGAAWTSRELADTGGGVYLGKAPLPPLGYTAYAVELTYETVPELGGLPLRQVLTTDVHVYPEPLPFAGTACRADRTILSGRVTFEEAGICAMALANGVHQFTCGEDAGWFQLDVPLDADGQANLMTFADGFAPFSVSFDPKGTLISVPMQRAVVGARELSLSVERNNTATPNLVRVHGQVQTAAGAPVCAMVLANGIHRFSCDDALGQFDFDVVPNPDDQVTVFGFADGFLPTKQVLAP